MLTLIFSFFFVKGMVLREILHWQPRVTRSGLVGNFVKLVKSSFLCEPPLAQLRHVTSLSTSFCAMCHLAESLNHQEHREGQMTRKDNRYVWNTSISQHPPPIYMRKSCIFNLKPKTSYLIQSLPSMAEVAFEPGPTLKRSHRIWIKSAEYQLH